MWSKSSTGLGALQGCDQGRPGTRDQGIDQPGVRMTTKVQSQNGRRSMGNIAMEQQNEPIIKGHVPTMVSALYARTGTRSKCSRRCWRQRLAGNVARSGHHLASRVVAHHGPAASATRPRPVHLARMVCLRVAITVAVTGSCAGMEMLGCWTFGSEMQAPCHVGRIIGDDFTPQHTSTEHVMSNPMMIQLRVATWNSRLPLTKVDSVLRRTKQLTSPHRMCLLKSNSTTQHSAAQHRPEQDRTPHHTTPNHTSPHLTTPHPRHTHSIPTAHPQLKTFSLELFVLFDTG